MNSSSNPSAGGGSKLKLYLIGAAVVLILGALLYFVGLQAGKAQLAAQAAQFGVERNGLESKVSAAETERDAARDRAAMMQARGSLYRTAIDLEARNFGTANNHLKAAASALATAGTPGVDALKNEIEATDLNVAVDLGQQRTKVLGFAEQLEKSMPAEALSAAAPTDSAPPAQP